MPRCPGAHCTLRSFSFPMTIIVIIDNCGGGGGGDDCICVVPFCGHNKSPRFKQINERRRKQFRFALPPIDVYSMFPPVPGESCAIFNFLSAAAALDWIEKQNTEREKEASRPISSRRTRRGSGRRCDNARLKVYMESAECYKTATI